MGRLARFVSLPGHRRPSRAKIRAVRALGVSRPGVWIRRVCLAEARRERERVLDERDPENLADWTLTDTRDARILLDALKRKS